MHFSKEEVQEAKDANLVVLLQSLGVPLKKFGREYMHPVHDSLKISEHKGWKWHSKDLKGNAVDYLMYGPDFNYKFLEAVSIIRTTLGFNNSINKSKLVQRSKYYDCSIEKDIHNENKELVLPKKYSDNRRVCAYLNKTRGIDYEFINKCIKHDLLYESAVKHNAVFLGMDYKENVKYAYQRGTMTSKKFVGDIDGSNKEYSFRIDGATETIRVFESPIDALSFLTLAKIHKRKCEDTVLSLAGVSIPALETFLKESGKTIRAISVCTDNDEAGKNCFNEIFSLFSEKYRVIDNRPKQFKDYNEQLVQTLNLQKGMER